MNHHIEKTRSQLGELGAMSSQNEAMERKILARAHKLLDEMQGKMDQARALASSGDEAAQDRYTEMVEEIGRLHQVIAAANEALSKS